MADYKIGQMLIVKKDIELEGIFGSKRIVRKGSKVWIGADKLAHHQDSTIQPLADGSTVEGYDTEGIAERIFTQLAANFPLEEFGEEYEIGSDRIKEEIEYALEELGM